MAAGIYQFWKYWLRDRKYIVLKLKVEQNAKPVAISMISNVDFTFVILILGLGLSLILFMIMIEYYQFIRYLKQKLRKVMLFKFINSVIQICGPSAHKLKTKIRHIRYNVRSPLCDSKSGKKCTNEGDVTRR